MITRWGLWIPISALLVTLPARVAAGDVLSNNGFNSCSGNADIKVERLNIKYDKTTRQVIFDVAGTSTKSQEVTAVLTVTAFGRQVYQRDFDPCDPATRVQQLCPGMLLQQHRQTPANALQYQSGPMPPMALKLFLQNMPNRYQILLSIYLILMVWLSSN